jgi:hypothetical protein
VAPPPPPAGDDVRGSQQQQQQSQSSVAGLSAGLLAALDALGGSSSVPDGVGHFFSPSRPVIGQPGARLGLSTSQAGLTLPVPLGGEGEGEAILAAGSAREVRVRTNAILPDDRVLFPHRLWDVQAGGTYVRQYADGSSWGFGLSTGSASDQPFHSIVEMVVSALAFYRVPAGGEDCSSAWLYYVVSTTNGQLGRNIPVPGVAYEFKGEHWSGTVGFPFVTLRYKPIGLIEWSLDYAALTDVQTRLSLLPCTGDTLRLYGGFAWSNQSYLRADRVHKGDLLFYYEKRAETGLAWTKNGFCLEATTGLGFDRYFVENAGLSLGGRNRVSFGAAPFAGLQLGLKY